MTAEFEQLRTSLTCLAVILFGFGFLQAWHFSKRRVPLPIDPFMWLGMMFVLLAVVAFIVGNEPWHLGLRELYWQITLGLGLIGTLATWIRYLWKGRETTPQEKAILFIVGLVSAMVLANLCLVPSLVYPAFVARMNGCKNNLKSLGLAMHNYYDAHNVLPRYKAGDPPVSWRVQLLPYLGHKPLRLSYTDTAAWDSQTNLHVGQVQLGEYQCPSDWAQRDTDQQGRHFTSYTLPVSDTGIFREGHSLTFPEITDGTSNTLMVLEACQSGIVWTEPRDRVVAEHATKIRSRNEPMDDKPLLSSDHPDQAMAAFADGSVRRFSSEIDPAVLQRLLTADGQEDVSGDDF